MSPRPRPRDRPEPPPPDLPEGYVRFFDDFRPPLASGSYRLEVKQRIVDDSGKATPELPTEPFVGEQRFEVEGPRFRLDPTDLFAVFPPGAAVGEFGDFLPQVVLTRRTLPWERDLGTGDDAPWLALLLLTHDEILDGGDAEANPTGGQTLRVDQCINLPRQPEGDVLSAQLQLGELESGDLQCRAIDIRPATFTAIAPRLDELAHLTHCRLVNPERKEIVDKEERGWYSVVVGNRFPSTEGRNTAHLVSLESLGAFLPGGGSSPAGYAKVRLISLASWYFTARRQRGNFASLMRGVRENSGLLRMPVDAALDRDSLDPPQRQVLEALDSGYTAASYAMRQGEATAAWYRGPLLPVSTRHAPKPEPFVNPSAAMIYDPASGLFDLSYAAAWQIGRLVALADKWFSSEMAKLGRSFHRRADLALERRRLYRRFGRSIAFPDELGRLLDRGLIADLVFDFWTRGIGARAGATADGEPLLGPSRDPSGLVDRLDRLPGVVSPAEMEAILRRGDDPVDGLRRRVFERAGEEDD